MYSRFRRTRSPTPPRSPAAAAAAGVALCLDSYASASTRRHTHPRHRTSQVRPNGDYGMGSLAVEDLPRVVLAPPGLSLLVLFQGCRYLSFFFFCRWPTVQQPLAELQTVHTLFGAHKMGLSTRPCFSSFQLTLHLLLYPKSHCLPVS